MAFKKIISISMVKRDLDILGFLENRKDKGGISAYIKKLIRKDMKSSADTELPDEMKKAINSFIKENYTGLLVNTKSEDSIEQDVEIASAVDSMLASLTKTL